MLAQAMEQYMMLDLANGVLAQCWDVCYERNLTREELVKPTAVTDKTEKMEACARKCVNREFEVIRLMNESVMENQRQKMLMELGVS